MKRVYITLTILALAFAAFSCARTASEDSNDMYARVLAAWVRVNYGKDIHPNDSGVYVLNFVQGDGTQVGDSSFVYAHYVCKDLDGNILSTNKEDLCKQLGTYSKTDYYGSDIWQMGMDAIPVGLEPIIRTMKAGAKATVALPVGQAAVSTSGYNAFSTTYSDNVIYEIELERVEEDVDALQDEALKEFSQKYFNCMDTTAAGFYYSLVSTTDGCDSIPDEREISVWYIGRLLDGKVFDTNIEDTAKFYRIYSSSGSYEALTITYYKELSDFLSNSSYVQGFTYALSMMKFGDTAETFFRSDYGYGAGGNGASIPEYSPLRFTLYIQPSDD